MSRPVARSSAARRNSSSVGAPTSACQASRPSPNRSFRIWLGGASPIRAETRVPRLAAESRTTSPRSGGIMTGSGHFGLPLELDVHSSPTAVAAVLEAKQ